MAKTVRQIAIELNGEVSESLFSSANKAIKKLAEIDKTVSELTKKRTDMARFTTLQKTLADSNAELATARERVSQLEQALRPGVKLTKEQRQELKGAREEAYRLEQITSKHAQKVASTEQHLRESGIDLARMADESAEVSRQLADAEKHADKLREAEMKRMKRTRNVDAARDLRDKTRDDLINTATITYGLAQGMKAPIDKAVALEDAMAEVRKYVDFESPKQFQQMAADVQVLARSSRMTAPEIAQLVAFGGQLKIPQRELVGFARDASMMGIAFGSSAEEAGATMAAWRASLRLTQPQVIALADQVNYLSNETGASALAISDVIRRVGSLGSVAGVSSGQIAAMGTTLVKAGVSEEIAATGLKNFMLGMSAGKAATKAQAAAFKELDFSTTDLAKRMQQDARGAILDVLSALQRMPKDRQLALLTDMFGKESLGAIAPLLTSLRDLRGNLDTVGDRTKYSGSMQREFAAQMAVTSAKVAELKNTWDELSVALGNQALPAVNATLGAVNTKLGGLADTLRQYPALAQGIDVVGTAILAVFGAATVVKLVVFAGAYVKSAALIVAANAPLLLGLVAIGGAIAIIVDAIRTWIEVSEQQKRAAETAAKTSAMYADMAKQTDDAYAKTGADRKAVRAAVAAEHKGQKLSPEMMQVYEYNYLKRQYPQKFALGGILTRPTLALAAEAGPEAIIPLNRTARARSLWEQTGQAIGAGGGSITFAPTITIAGSASKGDVQEALSLAMDDFKRLMDRYQREGRRTAFAGG